MKTQRRTGLRAITSRIVILMSISLLFFTLIPSQRVFAVGKSPQDLAKAWNAGLALSNCSGTGWRRGKLTSETVNKGLLFNTGAVKTVGYLVDSTENGSISCTKPADIKLLFSVLEEDTLEALKNMGIYKINSDSTGYDVALKDDEARSNAIKNYFEKKFGFSYSKYMPRDLQYATLKASFLKRCAGAKDSGGQKVHIVDDQGKLTVTGYILKGGSNDVVEVGYSLENDGGNDQKMSCTTIVEQMKIMSAQYIITTQANIADGDDSNDPDSSVSDDAANNEDSCESQSGSTAWIMCPAINIVGGALNWVDVQLTRLMEIDNNKYSTADGDNALYSAWSKFRNIGLTLLIAAMLVMVISTALGVGALDAYTVKKAFPRMVVSVIFMMLSWYVCVFLINVSNVVGRGTLGLMTSPFGSSASSLSSLFSTASGADIAGGTVVSLGGLAILGSAFAIPGAAAILFSWLGAGLLIMLIAFLTLIARQMFVLVLILGAPIAILSWIFPGNDKLWKLWWSSFSKLLLMFPLVMALIASGRIFAGATNSITDASTGESLLNVIIKFTAYVVPYAFIPLTFKAAGGVFGNLAGMANDRSKGAFDRLKKGRQKNQAEIGQRMGAGQGFRGSQRNVLNRASSGIAAGPKGWNPVSSRKRNAIRQSKMANLGASSTKDNEIYQANKNDDNFLLAVASKRLANEKLRAAKKNLDKAAPNSAEAAKYQQEVLARESAIAAANSITGKNQATQRQAALDLAATGYQLSYGQKGIDELREIGQATSGGDQGAFSAFMNTAQYNAKGAGRTDLGGLNAGASFNTDTKEGRKAARDAVKSGIRKVNGFTRGNGKGDTYTGGADAWLGEGTVGKDGKVLEGDALTSRISQNYKSGEVELGEVAQWHSMLLNDHAQASDANKIIIQKQIDAIEKVEEQYKTEIPVDVPDQERRTAFMAELSENRKKISRNNMDPNIRDTL